MLLTKPVIETEIAARRLVVEPTPSEEQIGASSIDLRLGNTFVTFDAQVARQQQTTGVPTTFDAVGYNFDNLITDYGKVERLADSDSLVLAPWTLTLGWTKEHIRLPSTLAARVEGRSKAARRSHGAYHRSDRARRLGRQSPTGVHEPRASALSAPAWSRHLPVDTRRSRRGCRVRGPVSRAAAFSLVCSRQWGIISP